MYFLIGQENYLLEESVNTIKSAIKISHDYEEKIISIQSAEDWNTIRQEANSYSLFSDTVLLNVFFDKKSMDATGKKILGEYLHSINTRCFIIIRAPNIPAKQVQWLSVHEQVVLSIAYPFTPDAMKNWIRMQLKNKAIGFDPQIPDLIHQYTQGNMLACAQVLEKIELSCTPDTQLDALEVQAHLSVQCEHDLFELVDACLLGQSDKAIQILRHAATNKTEPTLVLWMLAQEIRLLMQLSSLLEKNIDIKSACNQLKIWPQRTGSYQACYNRINRNSKSIATLLHHLHRSCFTIDERIKSNLNKQVWNALESVVLGLSLGMLPFEIY